MALFEFLFVWSCLFFEGFSSPSKTYVAPRQDPSTTSPPSSPSTACGDIIVASKNGYVFFEANLVYECLQSVPFDAAVATSFVDYLNITLQFQSTLETLKSPPAGYQQPAFDVPRAVESIRRNVTSGVYSDRTGGQYDFEADIQRFISRIHDNHVSLSAGILSVFSFASPFGLVSASTDGKAIPEVYIDADITQSKQQGWTPSPIDTINGEDAIQYLARFADSNSEGYLEPHADWNALMNSPSLAIQTTMSTFQYATHYPGDSRHGDEAYGSALNVTFKNGSHHEEKWVAIYIDLEDTGPLLTGGDFYNFFVLGLLPDSSLENDSDWKWWPDLPLPVQDNSTSEEPTGHDETVSICAQGNPTAQNWCNASHEAYPNNPIIAQDDLTIYGAGVITGYILDDISTGVLSIPSFVQGNSDPTAFRHAIQGFIEAATNASVERIVIDVQRNPGGSGFLPYDTFKLFFPSLDPYGASRMRSHELANVLGGAYTGFWSRNDPRDLEALQNEWVVTSRLNANTNTTFASWAEYFGPATSNGDTFSLPQRYNLSDEDFDYAIFPGIPWGYDSANSDELSPQPWAAEDIVILTDGLCTSSCALFVEFMSHQAGVRTIAVGGLPQEGPMQAVSGSRGAASYSADALDYDFDQVNETLHDMDAFSRLPNRKDNSMWTNYLGITLRNQVRDGDPTPLQFLFQAADCRIYYTLENVYNMSQLWRDVAYATWNDTSACVSGSTGYPTARNTTSTKVPPTTAVQILNFDYRLIPDSPFDINSTYDLIDTREVKKRKQGDLSKCTTTKATSKCRSMTVSCGSKGSKKVNAFSKKCEHDYECPGPNAYCGDMTGLATKKAQTLGTFGSKGSTDEPVPLDSPPSTGWCQVDIGRPWMCGN